jgi:hypothetical protein
VRNLGILAVIVIILLVFGAGSAGILPKAPVIMQTTDPNASVTMATPEQANQLFFFIVFVIINLVGAGATIAVLFWFLGRATNNARSLPNTPPPFLNRKKAIALPTTDGAQLPDKTS